MIEFTVEVQKKVANPHGVVEIKLCEAKVLYPHDYNGISMSEDDLVKRQEALFYIRNFLLADAMKKDFKDPYFKGIRTAEIINVRELEVEELETALENKELFNIHVDSLRAVDVDKMDSMEIYHTIILMHGDNTGNISPRLSKLKKSPVAEKRVILKKLLNLHDVEVEVLEEEKTTIGDKIKKKKAGRPKKQEAAPAKATVATAKEIS